MADNDKGEISDADIIKNLPADSSQLPSGDVDHTYKLDPLSDRQRGKAPSLSVSVKAPAAKHESAPIDPLNYSGAAESVPGAQIQEQFSGGRIKGTSTVFHWNYDGSRDSEDPGSTSAFGYNLDDKSLAGVAVPWDVLEAKFGKFTRVVGPSGQIERLNTPEAKAIADRIKSSSVVVTAPDGSRHVFPIVDIQGSMRGHQQGDYGPHALDLTLAAAQEMGFKDNAPVSYSIVPGTADVWAAQENQKADPTSLLSIYKQKFPESGKDESGNAPSDDEILKDIRQKYYPDVPQGTFDRLARLPGGTKPLDEHEAKEKPPIDQFLAKYPQYKDMKRDDLVKAVWDHLSDDAKKLYKGVPIPGMTQFDSFKEEFAPEPWMHYVQNFGDDFRKYVVENFPANKQWFDAVGEFLNQNMPFRKEMQAGWDQLAPAFGMSKGQWGSNAYEQYRDLQKKFFEWTNQQAQKAKEQAPKTSGIEQHIAASIGGAVAGIPVGIATWAPFAEIPGLNIASGALLDMASTYQQEKDAGKVNAIDVSSQGITRTVQGLIFSSRAGRIASGLAMAAAGATMRDATDWLNGRKPNSIDKQVADAALDMLMGVWFKDGHHSRPVQEEIDAAHEAAAKGDDKSAAEHADRASVLMTPAEREANLKGIQDLIKKQVGDPLKPAMKVEDLPEAWKPKKNGQTVSEVIQKPRIRVKAVGREVSSDKIRAAAVRMPDGETFTGQTHYDAYQKAYKEGYEAPEDPQSVEGFVDYSGKFLTREQAGGGKKLYSGDIEQTERTNPLGLIGSKEDIAEAKTGEQKFIGSPEDIAARDKAFEYFNFGFGDPFRMIRDMFSRDKDETLIGKSWKTLFAPQYLKPSSEFETFRPEAPLTPAQHMKVAIQQEGWVRQLKQNAQTSDWLRKSDLLDRFRTDMTQASRREQFFNKYSDRQINAMERGLAPMDEGYANMNAIYEHLGNHIRAEDAANNYHFSTKNIFPQLIKRSQDLKDIDAQLRVMNIDPENLTSEQFNALMDEIHNLKNSSGKEVELNTYNPEKIWQMRLSNTLRAEAKQNTINRARREGSYILRRGEPGPADKSQWGTIYAPDGHQYRIEPSANVVWDAAYNPSWFDSSVVGRTVGKYGIDKFNRAKQLTLGLKLFSPVYHTVNIALTHVASTSNIALAKFLDDPRGSGKDMARLMTSQLMAMRGKDPVLDYIRGKKSWDDLNDQQKYEANLMREGGLSAKISEEHEKQFIPFHAPIGRAANDLLNIGYNIVGNWGGVKQFLFGQVFPSMKKATYLEYAKQLLEQNPDLMGERSAAQRGKRLTDLGDMIDSRYSELNWNNVFWNKALKEIAIAHLMAPGWTLGFWRMHGGALHDFTNNMANLDKVKRTLSEDVNRPTEKRFLTNQMLYAAQYMALAAATNLAVFYLMNGPGAVATFWDAFYPRVGKNPDGTDKRIRTPFWINEYSLMQHDIQEKGGLAGPFKFFIQNKLAPTTSAFLSLVQNVDYQNNQIYSSMPIQNFGDLAGRVKDVMDYAIREAVVPMAFEGNKADFINLVGIGSTASKWTTQTALENQIIADYHNLKHEVTPKEEVNERAVKREYRQAFREHDPLGEQKALDEAKQLGIKIDRSRIAHEKPETNAQFSFSRLDHARQAQYLKMMSPEERKVFLPHASKEAKRAFYATQ